MQQQYTNLWEQLNSEYLSNETNTDIFDLLQSMAYRLTCHIEEAEDLVQDALEAFLIAKPNIDIQNMSYYLYRTLKNIFLNVVQSNKRRAKREQEYIERQSLICITLETKEEIKYYNQLLFLSLKEKLNEKEYQFLEILHSNLSLEDIAEELGVTAKTIQNRRSKIRKKLKCLVIK